MRLAYLCNVYPAVSHSFVRREIEGVERAGHVVHRFTLRRPPGDLRDGADLREAGRTEAVLEQGLFELLRAAVRLSIARPKKTLSAIKMARRLSSPGFNSKLRHFAYWLEAAWLVRRLEKLGVQHLHAHFGTNPAAVAAIGNAWGGASFSFTTHGPNEFDSPLQLSLPQKIAAAKLVVGISQYGRSQLMRWSAPQEWPKIMVVRCGLGPDFLRSVPKPIAANSRHFVCVARLSPAKGLPLLVQAAALLRDRNESFTVDIVGDGELRSALDRQIGELGLRGHVRLLGVQSSSEIREHLEQARAFVLPSFAEGLPVVLMEALALGRPVITTPVAGIPELVDKECGWLIPFGSDEALALAMTEVLHCSVDELNRKGAVGRKRVGLMHDAERNAKALVDTIAAQLPSCLDLRRDTDGRCV